MNLKIKNQMNMPFKKIQILLIITVIISCSKEKNTPNDTSLSNVWDGPVIYFEKKDEADQLDKINQDSITENVIITQGNDGGEFLILQKKTALINIKVQLELSGQLEP